MITKVNIQYLSDEYMAEYNKEKRDLYTKFVNNYQTELKHQIEWRDFVRKNNIYITFFDWYEILCEHQKIENPLSKIYQSPKITQDYHDIVANKEVTSIHPPKVHIAIEGKYLAKPLLTPSSATESKDLIKDIIYQNNYSNEMLNTMSQQLIRIEGNQNKIPKNQEESSSSKSIIKPASNPLFIPHQINNDANLGYSPKLVKELTERLTNLTINTINQNSDDSSSQEEDKISDLEQQFINNTQKINRYKFKGYETSTSRPNTNTFNYYPRPTFPDVQYEDKDYTSNRTLYDGTSVYEWNIDGYSEHQILNFLTELNMAANAYKLKNNNQSTIASLLLSGFTGLLRGW